MCERVLCVTVHDIVSHPYVARATISEFPFVMCVHVLKQHPAAKPPFNLHDYHTGGNALLHSVVFYAWYPAFGFSRKQGLNLAPFWECSVWCFSYSCLPQNFLAFAMKN